KPGGGYQTREDLAAIGKPMNTTMVTKTTVGPPAHSGSFVFSNAWALGSDVRIGTMAALVYDRKFERRVGETIANYTLAPTPDGGSKLTRANDLEVERGIDHVSWGGLAGVTLEIGKDHRISLTGLHTRAADIEASELEGYHEERAARIHESRLSFVSRSLTFGQLSGEHTIHPLNDMVVSWGLGLARATRDEPDTRASVYQYDGTLDVWAFEDDSTSGSHFYANQGETTYSGTLDVKQPLGTADHRVDVKIGGAVSVRQRAFEARRFRFRPNRKNAPPGFDLCPGATYDRDCPARLFTDDNVASGALELEEGTRDNDGYDAGLDVYAGYAMLDADVAPGWRVVVGPRLEVSSQDITPFDPVSPDAPRTTTESGAPALLPAASVVWTPIAKANVRASLTKTVARPQLRELAPFGFTDYFGGREVRGNPDLEETAIVNADTRFEYFPTSREVVAVSAFYKRFEDPIEQIILPAGARGITSFVNAPSADLFGIELEARKSLDVFADVLRPLSIIGNVTFAHSSVGLDPETSALVTSKERPLSLQAPYILNVALDFDEPDWGFRARALYNVVGPRLSTVGTNGLPDIYDEPRHQLDLTLAQKIGPHVEVRASAQNLLDWPTQRTQGDQVVGEYRLGQTFSLGVGIEK
ncbi:MAG TPA: TonB-dependent receptor, partial [Polyangiaceae bacterium]|nr:TonB-dependent receptor [Polyangiaceae bacterium]